MILCGLSYKLKTQSHFFGTPCRVRHKNFEDLMHLNQVKQNSKVDIIICHALIRYCLKFFSLSNFEFCFSFSFVQYFSPSHICQTECAISDNSLPAKISARLASLHIDLFHTDQDLKGWQIFFILSYIWCST